MQITKENVENVLRSSDIPFSVAAIIERLDLDEEHESTLKTSPEKRVKVVLYRLEKQGSVKAFKFTKKEFNYYRYTGNFIKNLFTEIMLSNLNSFYKNEFMLYCSNVLSDKNLKTLKKQIEINKKYKEEQRIMTDPSLEEVREKAMRLTLDSKNKNHYFS